MDYYAIGQRIRKIRKARGLSQEQLAERVGISITHMSHIETGNTKLSLEVFAQLVSVLEARADEVLFEQPDAVRTQALDDIIRLLDGCTGRELCVMADILKSTKISLEKYM